jgi:hypothetical protein
MFHQRLTKNHLYKDLSLRHSRVLRAGVRHSRVLRGGVCGCLTCNTFIVSFFTVLMLDLYFGWVGITFHCVVLCAFARKQLCVTLVYLRLAFLYFHWNLRVSVNLRAHVCVWVGQLEVGWEWGGGQLCIFIYSCVWAGSTCTCTANNERNVHHVLVQFVSPVERVQFVSPVEFPVFQAW